MAKDNNTVSDGLEEDIPDVVPESECDARLSVFCKSFSTPPKKVKHSVYGIGSFQRITDYGFYSYESISDSWVIWLVDPSKSPN